MQPHPRSPQCTTHNLCFPSVLQLPFCSHVWSTVLHHLSLACCYLTIQSVHLIKQADSDISLSSPTDSNRKPQGG
jgi:hypothetical protein